MSDPGDAKSIKELAASWLERRDRSDWSQIDQAELDIWLDQSMAHATAFWRLEGAWQRTERLSALREPMRTAQGTQRSALRRSAPWAMAIVLGVVVAATGSTYFATPREKTYSTPIGGHEIVTLRDGTSIELNTDTSIHVAQDDDTRNITLERGEAYFQVVHDPARPFAVQVGTHRVVDIGTKFLLRKDTTKVEVALYEGEASFESLKSGAVTQKTVLRPGDMAIATPTHPSFKTIRSQPADTLIDKLAWQRGFLVMDHTTLAEVVRDLNRYNVEKIVITDPSAARMEMYGTIPINGVNGFVRVAQGVLGLRATRRGDEIQITK